MTSKLKCPFCQTELNENEEIGDCCCPNIKCEETTCLSGSKMLWYALVQATNTLEEIKKYNKAMLSVLGEQIPQESTDTEEYCWWTSCKIQDCLNALEQIEHKE